jgi:hypothetical protein
MVAALDETNLEILRTIGVYRIGTRSSIARLLDTGAEPDKRLSTLIRKGYLRSTKCFAGNRAVYRLTKRGAAVAGVSLARCRKMGGQSLLKNLGVLLFCGVPGTERHRVEAADLVAAVGEVLRERAYCLCRTKAGVVVMDCYVPGPETTVGATMRRLEKLLREVRTRAHLAEAVWDRRFGFAVILHTEEKKKALLAALRMAKRGESPLIGRARVWVEVIDELGVWLGTGRPSLGDVSSGAPVAPLSEDGTSNCEATEGGGGVGSCVGSTCPPT